jgi:hypothetical protein
MVERSKATPAITAFQASAAAQLRFHQVVAVVWLKLADAVVPRHVQVQPAKPARQLTTGPQKAVPGGCR